MNIKTAALTAILLCGVSAGAMAAPIAAGSTISFNGASACTTTACTFSNTTVNGGATSSFAPFTAGNAATFATFNFNPFTAQQVYTTTEAGLTTTFSVVSQTSMSQQTTSGLTLTTVVDAGFATLTGFDATPGNYVFTANQFGTVTGTFSATSAVSAVPEPISISLLGAGLVGLGFIRRRSGKSA